MKTTHRKTLKENPLPHLIVSQLKKIWGEKMIIALTVLFYVALTFILFSRQSYQPEGSYPSDLKAYIAEMEGDDSEFYFSYPLLFAVAGFVDFFCDAPLAMALTVTFLNGLSLLFMIGFFRSYFHRKIIPHSGIKKRKTYTFLICMGALSIFFVSMLYPPTPFYLRGEGYRYLGIFTPNPYHNATYMATRPFAILTFFIFADLLDEYESKTDIKKHLALAVSFLLTTLTKPSFSLVFAFAGALVVAFRFFRRPVLLWKQTIFMALCFLPSAVDLLYQYTGMFGDKALAGSGIGFGWGTAWHLHTGNITLSVVKGAAFILIVTLLGLKAVKNNTLFRFSLITFLIGFLMMGILYQTGERMKDMNFAWGYMHGLFFAMAAGFLVLLEKTLAPRQNKWLCMGQWGIYALHLICGILYFSHIFMGGMYY